MADLRKKEKFMKSKKSQLLTAIAIICAIILPFNILSLGWEAPAKRPANYKSDMIDVQDVRNNNLKVEDLLAVHKRAVPDSMKSSEVNHTYFRNGKNYFFKSREGVNEFSKKLDENPNAEPEQSTIQIPAQQVTPAAYLTSVIKDLASKVDSDGNISNEGFNDAYEILTDQINRTTNQAQKRLILQARTLLVRAHPEVIPNLATSLTYLPNRFVSYFKEKLPTLSTEAGRQRFTQSIVMETLKSMPTDAQIEAVLKEAKLEDRPVLNSYFNGELDKTIAKYTKDLDQILQTKKLSTQATLIAQWSRNIISEVGLLIYGTGKNAAIATGAIIGTGLGAAGGAIGQAAFGATASVAIGAATAGVAGDYIATGGKINEHTLQAVKNLEKYTPENLNVPDLANPGLTRNVKRDLQSINPQYFSRDVNSRSYSRAALDTVGGIAAGATTGALVTTAALTGTATGLPQATINGAVSGAYTGGQVGGRVFDAAGRAVKQTVNYLGESARAGYNRAFTRSSLTKENLEKLNSDTNSQKSNSTSVTSDSDPSNSHYYETSSETSSVSSDFPDGSLVSVNIEGN